MSAPTSAERILANVSVKAAGRERGAMNQYAATMYAATANG
jgi:hypothetical protein